ncbi:BrnA antitoxin family protein [Sphingomonas sp. MMS24-JH45]
MTRPSGPRKCSPRRRSRSATRSLAGQVAECLNRPPLGAAAKRQVTRRLDPDVIDKFREGGPGWQGRMNEALR